MGPNQLGMEETDGYQQLHVGIVGIVEVPSRG